MTTFICEKCGRFILEVKNKKPDNDACTEASIKVKIVCPQCLGKGQVLKKQKDKNLENER
jgi:rubredoxin